MTHHDKIPDLLNNLVLTPAISTAARAVGISREVVYSWLIASRRGDPKLQNIEWHGVVQPFHMQFANSKTLAIVNVEQLALDRAMNGSTYPSEFRGAPVFLEDERVVREFGDKEFDPELCDLLFGQRDKWLRDENGDRVRATTHQKPSENLVALVLQSWMSKYAKHATVDVLHGGIMRIDMNAPAGEAKMIENKAPEEIVQLEEISEDEKRGGYLAVPKPLTNTADIDAMNRAGKFASQDVTFTKEDGTTTVVPGTPPVSPADDPRLQDAPGDSPQVRELKALARRGPTNPRPRSGAAVFVGKPGDEPPPPPEPKQPEQRADQAGYGAGKVLPHGTRMV
jgi:hypothetical protein